MSPLRFAKISCRWSKCRCHQWRRLNTRWWPEVSSKPQRARSRIPGTWKQPFHRTVWLPVQGVLEFCEDTIGRILGYCHAATTKSPSSSLEFLKFLTNAAWHRIKLSAVKISSIIISSRKSFYKWRRGDKTGKIELDWRRLEWRWSRRYIWCTSTFSVLLSSVLQRSKWNAFCHRYIWPHVTGSW